MFCNCAHQEFADALSIFGQNESSAAKSAVIYMRPTIGIKKKKAQSSNRKLINANITIKKKSEPKADMI